MDTILIKCEEWAFMISFSNCEEQFEDITFPIAKAKVEWINTNAERFDTLKKVFKIYKVNWTYSNRDMWDFLKFEDKPFWFACKKLGRKCPEYSHDKRIVADYDPD